jgi:hypothetical protein
LGRFTEGRIEALNRLREELRQRGYVPIVFNFDKPETKDFTETVRLLAGLSKFVIADVTNPKSTPLELQATIPEVMVPFQPIIEEGVYGVLLGGEKASAVFADPPYNVPMKGHAGGKGRRKHREFPMASGEMTEDAFCRFLEDALGLAAAHSLEKAISFACMDWRHSPEIQGAIRGIGCEILNLCVWVKTNGGMGSLYRSQHEFVFVYGRAPNTDFMNFTRRL